MRTLNRRLRKCSGMYKTITNEELANRVSKNNNNIKPKRTATTEDTFDKEYNEFIADLKAKNDFVETNESEQVKTEEIKHDTESKPAEVENTISDNVSETSMNDDAVVSTSEVKKTRKKKNGVE